MSLISLYLQNVSSPSVIDVVICLHKRFLVLFFVGFICYYDGIHFRVFRLPGWDRTVIICYDKSIMFLNAMILWSSHVFGKFQGLQNISIKRWLNVVANLIYPKINKIRSEHWCETVFVISHCPAIVFSGCRWMTI